MNTQCMNHAMGQMEQAYADWAEEERRHAHIMSVHAILDQLGDSETDRRERVYQQKRLQYSPAYFSGHPDCCGECMRGVRDFDRKQYEHGVRVLGIFGLLGSRKVFSNTRVTALDEAPRNSQASHFSTDTRCRAESAPGCEPADGHAHRTMASSVVPSQAQEDK